MKASFQILLDCCCFDFILLIWPFPLDFKHQGWIFFLLLLKCFLNGSLLH